MWGGYWYYFARDGRGKPFSNFYTHLTLIGGMDIIYLQTSFFDKERAAETALFLMAESVLYFIYGFADGSEKLIGDCFKL